MKLSKFQLKCVTLLISLISSLTVTAQDFANLDSIAGISIFKFGADSNAVQNLEPVNRPFPDSRHVVYYRYTGDSLKSIYGIPIDEVLVYYYKNQLFRVDLKFGTASKEYTLAQYNQVHEEIEKRYGSKKSRLAMSGAVLLGGYAWYGEKIYLDHTRHSSPPKRKKDNGIYGEITFSDLALSKQWVLDKT